ncbi:MAG: pyridoxal-phosphate dependent enzyme, partial [Winogradskyella sp.]
MQTPKTSLIQQIPLKNKGNIELFIKREDLIHPFISGNKFRKLKYNIIEAKCANQKTILTFGGAYSNHIAATAYACKINGLKSIGVIRGEELRPKINENPTLSFAQSCGMHFIFVTRTDYRKKSEARFISLLKKQVGDFYLIPEGGTNAQAVKGCEEIITKDDARFDFICTCVGTGGTISGLINTALLKQKILGFPALKGDFISQDIRKFATQSNWELCSDYHFGGYAKIKPELISFINDFNADYGIRLDPIYT